MKIPLSDIPLEHQQILEEIRAKMQEALDKRAEVQALIDEKIGWEDGKANIQGNIEYSGLSISQWGNFNEAKVVSIDDFWYASDQDC